MAIEKVLHGLAAKNRKTTQDFLIILATLANNCYLCRRKLKTIIHGLQYPKRTIQDSFDEVEDRPFS